MKLPKKIIDANVILRFFLADDEKQFQKAFDFIQALEAGKDEALLTEIVFAEVVWVLQKVYHVPRTEIAQKFSKLMQGLGIKTFLGKTVFIEALRIYAETTIDIQDVFLSVLAHNSTGTVVTFNKKDFKKLGCENTEP
jgi:predicted nucleic-acid-binding protein